MDTNSRISLKLLWLVALASSVFGIRPVQAEVIRSFNVDLRLRPDTTLDVTETIVMDLEEAERHGIYRTIPVRYDRY
ncbi:MAG: DUF2207 domain-containing protein, partial [Armatimonadota bacterium]|nr:DUF2207 domain-containing protein [Armatimonadota bacterium]